jgi:putative membrane protein insertion efficiency factor
MSPGSGMLRRDRFHAISPNPRALGIVLITVLVVLNGERVAVGGIHAYQRIVSPVATWAGIRCRFTPSCSRYAETVIERDGLLRGGWKSLKRVTRCNPLTRVGTRDEP